ncbi:MAG: hypothetical protein P4L92_03425 [Rudaea sp.]|nr:hypothetical protein [Rudaea sp.]
MRSSNVASWEKHDRLVRDRLRVVTIGGCRVGAARALRPGLEQFPHCTIFSGIGLATIPARLELRAGRVGFFNQHPCKSQQYGAKPACSARRRSAHKENEMGKYFIAWLLGVPAGVLVLVYLVMHVF